MIKKTIIASLLILTSGCAMAENEWIHFYRERVAINFDLRPVYMSKMSIMSVFVDKFLELCESRNTTHYKVALDAGVDPSLVSNVISGNRKLKPDQMKKLLNDLSNSKLLGISSQKLIAWWALDLFSPLELAEALKALEDEGII